MQGSIEKYYIKPSEDEVDKQNEKHNFTIEGYVNIDGVQKSVLNLENNDISCSNRNPYQLVGLTNDKILVINQNLKFKFDLIYQIEFTSIIINNHSSHNTRN